MKPEELVKLGSQKGFFDNSNISSLVGVHQYLKLYQLFKKYVPKKSKVLDWGCGNGHFSYFLCRSGYKTVGFSIDKFAFKDWVKGCDYKFIQGKTTEPTKLPFKKNSFDVVVSVGVLEHVREFDGNEEDSMKEIFKILTSDGLFICYHLPNFYSLTEFIGKLLTNKFHHTKRFQKAEIKDLAKKTGFEILEVGLYGFLPRNSMSRFPKAIRFSKLFTLFWDILDSILSKIFLPVCQNYYFVAKKINKS